MQPGTRASKRFDLGRATTLPANAGETRASEPLLISARQAAHLLSISERTLRDRTKDGTIPAVRLQGRVLYSPSALRDWVARRLKGQQNT